MLLLFLYMYMIVLLLQLNVHVLTNHLVMIVKQILTAAVT